MLRRAQPGDNPCDNRYCSLVRNYVCPDLCPANMYKAPVACIMRCTVSYVVLVVTYIVVFMVWVNWWDYTMIYGVHWESGRPRPGTRTYHHCSGHSCSSSNCHTGAEGTELNTSTTMEDMKVCIPGAEGTELLFPTAPPTTYIPSNATDQSL